MTRPSLDGDQRRIISNYQAVVPSTWSSGPRKINDDVGPYEQSLVGTPVADPKYAQLVRTIHPFTRAWPVRYT
ncbi:nickel-dependent hydrogenase large subunit [Shigella flexneri]